jgi:hypothetical protein
MYMLQLVHQGYPTTPKHDILRWLFLLIYVLGMLLLVSYSATLTSLLAVADTCLPFNSLESLADNGKYRLGVLTGSNNHELMMVNHVNIMHQLGLHMRDVINK